MSDNLKTLKYYNKSTSQKVPVRISTDQVENTEGKPLTQILVPATSDTTGLLTASDKVKMDKLVDLANYLPVTKVDMTGFVVGTYDETTSETSLSVLEDSDPRSKAYVITPPASSDRIGGVIPGTGLSVNSSGVLSVNTATVMDSATNAATAASATTAGTADSATSAGYATSAGNAATASSATTANSANTAGSATSAGIATSASTAGYATSAGTATTATSAPNYLPLTGGTINGNLRIQSGNYGTKLNFGDGDYCYISEPTDDNLTIHVNSGKNLNLEGNVQINGTNIEDLAVNQAKSVYVSNTATTGSMHLVKGIVNNDLGGIIVGSTASDKGYLEIATGDNGDEPIYVKQYSGTANDFTGTARTATILDASGNTSFPGQVTATKFVGTVDSAGVAGSATTAGTATVSAKYATSAGAATSASTAATCTGNAATASGFNAARTMTIVNIATSAVGSSTWDGKAAVTISMNIASRTSVSTIADLDTMGRGRWVTNNNLLGFNETLHGEERHFGNLELQEMIPYTGWTWLRRCYTNNAWSAWYRYDANKKWDGTAWQLTGTFMSSVISATSAMTVPSASVATTSAKYATSAGAATSAGTCTGAAATAGTATVSAKYATSAGTCTGAAATAGTATVSAKYATSAGTCTGNAATATTAGTATVSAKFATSATGATNAANAANANTASSAIRSYYTVAGVCSTAAATAQKDVTIANALTNSSAVITVLFTQKNTAASPTLCLNGGTAHKICTYSAIRPTAFTSGTNQAVSFMFYGTAWRIVHPGFA